MIWWWWLLLAVIGIFVGTLTLAAIMGWFEENTTPLSQYGELIRKKLKSGKYKVIAGVFDKRNHKTAHHVWETDELDDELTRKFGSRDKIRISL